MRRPHPREPRLLLYEAGGRRTRLGGRPAAGSEDLAYGFLRGYRLDLSLPDSVQFHSGATPRIRPSLQQDLIGGGRMRHLSHRNKGMDERRPSLGLRDIGSPSEAPRQILILGDELAGGREDLYGDYVPKRAGSETALAAAAC